MADDLIHRYLSRLEQAASEAGVQDVARFVAECEDHLISAMHITENTPRGRLSDVIRLFGSPEDLAVEAARVQERRQPMRTTRILVVATGIVAWSFAYGGLGKIQEPLPSSALPALIIATAALVIASVCALYVFADAWFAIMGTAVLLAAAVATQQNWCGDLNVCEGSWTSGWLRSGASYSASAAVVGALLVAARIRKAPLVFAPLLVSTLAFLTLLDNIEVIQIATGFLTVPLIGGFLGWGGLLLPLVAPASMRAWIGRKLRVAAARVEH